MVVLLLLAFLSEAGYLALNRIHNLKQFVVEYIAISLAISIFYLVSCWWITEKETRRGARWRMGVLVLAGLVFRFTLVPLYPSLTEDPHRYRWEGKLQAAGGNPYLERPEDPRWLDLRDRTWDAVNRKELPSGYGPLLGWSHQLTYAAVARFEPDEFRQIQLFKIPYLLFDLATAAALALLLGRLGLPRAWLLIYFWSPLVVVEFSASGHNDSMLLFFLVAAVYAGCAHRWGWAFGALWMATLTKFWPALLFPLFLWSGGPRDFWGRAGRALGWTPVAALIASPYWGGGAELRKLLVGFLGGWRNNASLFNWIYAAAGEDYEQAKPVVSLLVAAAALLVAWRRPALPQGVLATAVALLFLSANCFPWYVTWLVPLLAVRPQAAMLLWTALVPLSYHILIGYQVSGQWLEDPSYLYLEYVPVYAMLLAGPWLRRYRRSESAPGAVCGGSPPLSGAG